MSWRDRQLDDVGVLDLVGLLFEVMTSCSFTRHCSKSQLCAEPEDDDVTVLTLEREQQRRPELGATGLRHWNSGSSADRTACRRPSTHTVRTNSGLCDDCQRTGGLVPHTAADILPVRVSYARFSKVTRSSVNTVFTIN
jgi:hypothetical protein